MPLFTVDTWTDICSSQMSKFTLESKIYMQKVQMLNEQCHKHFFLCLLALLFPSWVEQWCVWGDWRLISAKQPCPWTTRAPVRPMQPTGMLPLQPFSSLEMRYSRCFSVDRHLWFVRLLSCICVISRWESLKVCGFEKIKVNLHFFLINRSTWKYDFLNIFILTWHPNSSICLSCLDRFAVQDPHIISSRKAYDGYLMWQQCSVLKWQVHHYILTW